MRGLLIATLLAIVTLASCVQPQPLSPIAAPTGEVPPTADIQPTPAATTASPVAANDDQGPPPVAPAPAPAPSNESASASQARQTPAVGSPTPVGAAPAQALPTPAKPPVVVTAPVEPPAAPPSSAASQVEPAPSVASRAEPTTAPLPPTPAQAPASAALDLAGLAQRLRDTKAIGVFTKLSLKNQVDDLLDRFRGFYQGEVKVPLAELRQQYELLLLKVLTLVQDADQQLASAITSSREAIWGILADPREFAKI